MSSILFIVGLFGFNPISTNQEISSPHVEIVQNAESLTGSEYVSSLLEDYKSGKFKSFLKDMQKKYEKGSKNFAYQDFLLQRKQLSELNREERSSSSYQEMEKKVQDLEETRNKEILLISLKNPSLRISNIVKNSLFFALSTSQKNSLEFIQSLKFKFKGDGKSPLENRLINIDTAFSIQAHTLDLEFCKKNIDLETLKKQKMILEIEKLSQMEKACHQDRDHQMAKSVRLAKEIFPLYLAKKWDEQYLEKLSDGAITPNNQVETEIKSTMDSYNENYKKITENFFTQK